MVGCCTGGVGGGHDEYNHLLLVHPRHAHACTHTSYTCLHTHVVHMLVHTRRTHACTHTSCTCLYTHVMHMHIHTHVYPQPRYLKYLPNGVLGMNDRLIAHRVPEGIMLIHKEQLIALWKEAQRRLPYNAPPLPYNPIVTPIAPDTPAPQTPPVAAPQPPPPAAAAHMAHQESGSGVHYSVQPLTAGTAGTATPAVAPTALLPPAAVQTVPDPQSRVVQATLMPSPHNQQQQQQPVFVQPVAAAPAVQPVVRTTKQAGQYVAPAYVPYPSQRVPARPAARPAPAKQEVCGVCGCLWC